jgi:iron(III) transport system substrate-binding protein
MGGSGGPRGLTLYSSMDDAILRAVLAAYEGERQTTVAWLGDTEATKTTGLVERVLSERARPGADAWWSSEALGTMKLLREGAVESVSFVGQRRRAIVGKSGAEPVGDLRDLATGVRRVGMARPGFGTTRGHMAIVREAVGESEYRAWVGAMKAKGVRLYDGNATVVLGLTDTDDIEAGRAQGWDVVEIGGMSADERWAAATRAAMPTSMGIVRGARNPEGARALLEWLGGESASKVLFAAGTGFTPLDVERGVGDEARWARVLDHVDEAVGAWG